MIHAVVETYIHDIICINAANFLQIVIRQAVDKIMRYLSASVGYYWIM